MNILRLTQVPPEKALKDTDAVFRFGLLTTHIFPLSKALEKRGIFSTFYSGGGNTSSMEETVKGFKTYRTAWPSKPLFLPYGIGLEPILKKMKKKGNFPDILHAHNPHYAYGITRTAQKYSLPIVITVHGSFQYQWFEKPLLKNIFSNADHVIVINQPSRRMAKDFGAKEKNISLIHTGTNTDTFKPTVPKKDELLYVGRLVDWKNVDTLIRAFAVLPKKYDHYLLRIIGTGPLLNELKKISQSSGVENRVIFNEEIPHEKLSDYFSQARLTIVPHRIDSFGKTVIESLSCETPIVATDHDIPTPIFKGGWFYDYREASNHQLLADTIVKALTSKDLLKKGKVGRKIIMEEFTWDAVAEKNLKVYQSVLKN